MIRILVTGGTFDKEYDEIAGVLYFKETHIHEMLRLGRCRAPLTVETLMLVDSLQMTDGDRQLIADRCLACPERLIVITHGTDTMVETARALAQELSRTSGAGIGQPPAKTIVLTGAMVPYAFGSSDGMFNLGSAISFVQALDPGVYVAMNGTFFPWNNVRKNRTTGEFEQVEK